MMNRSNKQTGFTIVELLIVIVVIGILAAITIIAYNGVQSRAQAAAVSSALDQTNRKLALYMVDNSAYPPDLATAGINNSGGTSYQYSFNNAVSPQTYCVTATDGTTSYNASSTANTPTSGGCPGHGVGGVGAVTNLVTNPSFESNTTGWANYGISNNTTRSIAQAYTGSASMQLIEPSDAGYHGFQTNTPVSPNTSYIGSAYILRSIGSANIILRLEWYDSSNAFISANQTAFNLSSLPIGQWTRTTISATSPVNGVKAVLIIAYQGAPAGETLYGDATMLISGTSAYADGNSPNWIWNGTPNNSTSTGPAL